MLEVLISGASGFTGGALLRRLVSEDVRTAAFGRAVLQDPVAVRAVLRDAKPEWIFHLAGKLKGTASELFEANLLSAVHLLEAAAEVAPRTRILLIGSAAEYGVPEDDSPISEKHPCRPVGPYGLSKYAMTLAACDFAERSDLPVNVARAFNLIGPNIPPTLLLGAVIERTKKALADGANMIKVGDLSAERDFLDVRDAVDAYIAIMKSNASGEIFNICSGIPTSIHELVDSALRHAPRPIGYEIDPALGSGGARRVIGNPQKIQNLGFRQKISLEQSIADACAPIRS